MEIAIETLYRGVLSRQPRENEMFKYERTRDRFQFFIPALTTAWDFNLHLEKEEEEEAEEERDLFSHVCRFRHHIPI